MEHNELLKQVTSKQILNLSEFDCDKIFKASNLQELKKQYKLLAKLWHPDHNKLAESTSVFQKIQILFKNAEEKLKNNGFVGIKKCIFETENGKQFELTYLNMHVFELGYIYVGDNIVAYKINKEYEDLANNFVKIIDKLKYANKEMKEQIEPLMPILSKFETLKNKEKLIIIKKNKDILLLKDVLEFYDKNIDPKHVAWIISGFYNLSCYLSYNDLAHNGINLNACFINPKTHQVHLIGGWFYSAYNGNKITALPNDAIELSSPSSLKNKVADKSLDQRMINQLGLDLLGSRSANILKNKKIPTELINWLINIPSENAIKNYEIWLNKILISSFGKRTFVELDINSEKLYQLTI